MATLIAYATKHGCTEKCARELQKQLGKADLWNLKDGEPDLSKYDTVILGASVYATMPRKPIKAFAQKHTQELKSKKLGLFLCCMADGEQGEKQLAAAYPPELRSAARAKGVLGGGFNISDMGTFERFVVQKVSGKEAKDGFTLRQDVLDGFVKAFGKA